MPKKLKITAEFEGEQRSVELVKEDVPNDLTLEEVASRFRSFAQPADVEGQKARTGCCITTVGEMYKTGKLV